MQLALNNLKQLQNRSYLSKFSLHGDLAMTHNKLEGGGRDWKLIVGFSSPTPSFFLELAHSYKCPVSASWAWTEKKAQFIGGEDGSPDCK